MTHQVFQSRAINYFMLFYVTFRFDKAAECTDQAIKYNNKYPAIYHNRANAYFLSEKYVKAKKDAKRALELDSNDEYAKDLLVKIEGLLPIFNWNQY
jgi:tetratricopeptide (TPR) repeat protein